MKQKTTRSSLTAPVNPERFLRMTRVFQGGARVPLPPVKGPGWHLTDIPMNRGMLAVMSALKKERAPDAEFEPIMSRLMSLGEIFKARDYFGEFIRLGADTDGIDVADVLMLAAAEARFSEVGGRLHFDLSDVLARARCLEAGKSVRGAAVA